MGNRLLESGHYASVQIKQISGQLEAEWKAFAAALDERSTLLEMSAAFHQKCDQVGGGGTHTSGVNMLYTHIQEHTHSGKHTHTQIID